MTAFDMETANRFGVPYIAVIGNNSAMNQIRYGQLAKYGEERGNVGNLLGDVPFGTFARCWRLREEVRDRRKSRRRSSGHVSRCRSCVARRHQYLGGPREYARDQEPDHVQVSGDRNTRMAKALDGVRILDFTHVHRGPPAPSCSPGWGRRHQGGKGGERDITREQLRDIPTWTVSTHHVEP